MDKGNSVEFRDLLTASESFSDRVSGRIGEALDTANIHNINSVQALLLRRLGGEEVTVSNLTLQQHYIGTNVSYNVKLLIDAGYLAVRNPPTDRRARLVKATKKGLAIGQLVAEVEAECLDTLYSYSISASTLEDITQTLKKANMVLG
jgi:DNA-binding MarR family transcriptional regulator